jgi:hypothetical protein
MDSTSDTKAQDANFAEDVRKAASDPSSNALLLIRAPGHRMEAVHDYWNLIRDPCVVFNDSFYRALKWLPGHSFLWALLLGFGLLLPLDFISESVSPISHVRSYTEIHASYFFLPVFLVQILVMPVFYQAILKCFDSLRYAMIGPEQEIAQFRESLKNPDLKLQIKAITIILAVCLLGEEVSSARLSRFILGDWNTLDLWLLFANVTALTMFLWYLIMPINRTLLLARHIETCVSPRLFDERLGEPIAAFGFRAGLLFAIPYFFVGSFAPVILSDSWTYILPGLIGTVTAIGFAVVPAVPLRRIKRKLKRIEIERVNIAVAQIDVDATRGSLQVNRISEIVTLREYGREVSSLREWPFEARLVRGFSFYFLLIPMTWVGAAFVEMIVEQLAT